MNEMIVVLGILAVVGGVCVFAYFSSMASDTTLIEILVYPGRYDQYRAAADGGIAVGVIGLILIVLGAATNDKKESSTIPQRIMPIAPGATNFCTYCGTQVSPGAVWCPKCGRGLSPERK